MGIYRLSAIVIALAFTTTACPDDPPAGTDVGVDVSFETSDVQQADPAPEATPEVAQELPKDDGPEEIAPEVVEEVLEEVIEEVTPDITEEVVVPLICLLNNCETDAHCNGCTQDRNTCLVAENRCIACNPTTQEGCEAPLVCSPAGTCNEPTLVCPVDVDGNPEITCSQNSDCFACSPAHQVCDPTDNKCKNCTTTNTSHCLATQWCKDGSCAAKCPGACFADQDCQFCGDGENSAKACFAHKCSECSDTYPCAAGEICNNGTCIPPCGIPEAAEPGACQSASDCIWCGGNLGVTEGPDAWDCKFPINGATYGKCAPSAAGCSDLGSGTALPPPYDSVTNTCSQDVDCDGVGIEYNVGELIRNVAGVDKVDLGITEITIGDALVNYDMNSCASLELTDDISCGICVPCREDIDCAPIAVQPLLSDIFSDSTLANLAGKLLLDLLFGDAEEQNLNFQCQPIAAGYGACIPCANPLQPCGEVPPPTGGTCDHPVCEAGTPLSSDCGTCAAAVCEIDAYCCTTDWDATCIGLVDQNCTQTCGGGNSCNHGPCSTGDALSPECSPCTASVCTDDPYCCSSIGMWDQTCADLAAGKTECADECAGGCGHDECVVGAPLAADCSPCSAAVCGLDPYCCDTEWDSQCVAEAGAEVACSCQ